MATHDAGPEGSTLVLDDGSTIWYARRGNGPLMISIHGSGFGHRNFERLTPHLVADFDVIDIDLPGYGKSLAAGSMGVSEWATYVAEFIEKLDEGAVVVHGTSMGGLVALSLASQRPDLVRRLVLSCCMMRYDNAARHMRQTWKLAARDSGMVAAADLTAAAGFSRSFYDRDDAQEILESLRFGMSSNEPESFIAGTESLEALDLSGLLPGLVPPTVLIAGDEDQMTPPHAAKSGVSFDQAVDIIPDARMHTIEASGHYLVLERPAEAAAVIREFLAS